MTLGTAQTIGLVGGAMSALPFLIGLIRLAKRTHGEQALWFWLAFSFALNAVGAALAMQGIRNTALRQLSYPVFCGLALYALAQLTDHTRAKRWIYAGFLAYIPFWTWRTLAGELEMDFAALSGPVLWMLLTLAGVGLILVALNQGSRTPLRDPRVIIGIALLVSYAPSAAIEPASVMLIDNHRDLVVDLWGTKAIFLVLGSLLFSLAMLWTVPPRALPGSSLSAA